MASTQDEIAADNAAVEDIRAKFGNAEAAKLAADLYKLQRNPPAAPTFAGFPRWAVVLVVLWVAALETADKLPRLLLAYPAYEATLAEYEAKMMQPDMVQAQLVKARNEAKASNLQPDMMQAQLDKAKNEAKASDPQPEIANAQLEKLRHELKAAEWQPYLTAAQGMHAGMEFLRIASDPGADVLRKWGNATLYGLRP